jgi:hypothetical protein
MMPAAANTRASKICTTQSAIFIVHFSSKEYG